MNDEHTFLITPAGELLVYPDREEAEQFLRGVRSREPFAAQLFDDVHELFEHVTGSKNETVLEFLLVAACGTFPALDPNAAPHLSPYQYAVAKELRSLSQFGLIGYAQAFVVFNVLEQGSATPGAKAGNLVDFEGYHSGGGHKHLLLHRADKRIVTIHFDCDDAELALVEESYQAWDSFDAYLDAGFEGVDGVQSGFGWEFDQPDYEARHAIH